MTGYAGACASVRFCRVGMGGRVVNGARPLCPPFAWVGAVGRSRRGSSPTLSEFEGGGLGVWGTPRLATAASVCMSGGWV